MREWLAIQFRRFIVRFGTVEHPYPLEGILRPPLELWVALVAFGVSFLFFIAPFLFLMSPFYGDICALALALFGLRRFCQGCYVVLYQKYINELPVFKITPEQLRHKYLQKNRIYVGRGFEWKSKHAQRFYDLESVQDFERYVKPIDTSSKASDAEDNPLGGKAHIHGVGFLEERDFYLNLDDRIGNMLVYGQSRSGKSKEIELFVEQDILNGEMVIGLEPKGDPDAPRRYILACARAGRLKDLKIFHLGYLAQSVRYNPIGSFQKLAEIAGRITINLPTSGDSQAFANFAWRFLYIVSMAMDALAEPITLRRLKNHVQDLDRIFARYAQHYFNMDDQTFAETILAMRLEEDDVPKHLQGKSKTAQKILHYIDNNNIEADDTLQSLINAYSYEKTYYDKITASLLPFLEKMNAMGDAISPEAGQSELPELNFYDEINQNSVVLILLDGLSDQEIAHAFGAMVFSDVVSTAGRKYKETSSKKPIMIHADEFNDIISDIFLPLINKGGGAGMIVNAYTQTDQDIEGGFSGSNAVTKAMIAKGNFRTIGCMRVATEETAQFFSSRLKDINVKYSVSDTSLSDSDSEVRGTSASTGDKIQTEKQKLITDPAIMSQPVAQQFFSKHGNHIFHVRIPLIDDDLDQLVGRIEDGGLQKMIYEVNMGEFTLPGQQPKQPKTKGKPPENKPPTQSKAITGLSTFESEGGQHVYH